MPTLHLVIFKPWTILSKDADHWALFLPEKEGDPHGDFFGVKKNGYISKMTEFEHVEHCDIQQLQEYTNEIRSIIALTELGVDRLVLLHICRDVTQDRPFDLITRNCQHWVCEVIKKLEKRLNVEQTINVLARIKGLGISPLRDFKEENQFVVPNSRYK